MSLFLKIFLWFWLATALVIGVLTFITWTTQTEPFVSRWRHFTGVSLNIYTKTARQIYESEGARGVQEFLRTVKSTAEYKGVCLVGGRENARWCDGEFDETRAAPAISRAAASIADEVEFEPISPEENYFAKKFNAAATGETFTLVLRLEAPRPPLPLGGDWLRRLLRISAVILTAGLLCYALARYLVAPVLKLRSASQKLAAGDLHTRIKSKRRDELGQLARDFDEMAERIESLLASQKRLTRDVSHELRSPLARMNVALELAKQKSDAETLPLLERIETEAHRLNEMISQILTLSKLESRAEKIEKSKVDLVKIVEYVVEDAAFEAANNGKSVKILRLDDCRVSGNESLLRSAIENVVRNAVRYTQEKTTVEVSLLNENGNAKIEIRDYGAGVPENELDEMFRPFYRIGEARERKTGGIGLGLAITEQAVRAHDGKIKARNAASGGLIVEIELPHQ